MDDKEVFEDLYSIIRPWFVSKVLFNGDEKSVSILS